MLFFSSITSQGNMLSFYLAVSISFLCKTDRETDSNGLYNTSSRIEYLAWWRAIFKHIKKMDFGIISWQMIGCCEFWQSFFCYYCYSRSYGLVVWGGVYSPFLFFSYHSILSRKTFLKISGDGKKWLISFSESVGIKYTLHL